ncbi:MAG: efflux transporter periplasmic adaptor subunit [Sulfurimonas sp.]
MSTKVKKYLKIGISIVVVLGLIVGGKKAIQNTKEKDAAESKAKIYPIVVSQMSPKLKNVKLTLPFLATVENDKDVKLSSRIAARILSIKSSGSSVKSGEVIAQLDTTDIRSNLVSIKEQIEAANVSINNLQATHKRTLELLKVQGASIEESQKESTMIASAIAQRIGLKQKEIELLNNLSYCNITSPVNGVVAKTFDKKGAISMPGKPLIAISSKNGFYLMIRVPTKLPMKAVEFNEKSYMITALGTTEHGLAEYKAYIGSNNLTTGDRVEIDVVTFNDRANLLPFDALLDKDGKSFVLVIDKNRALAKEVHVVQSAEQGIIIEESLKDKNIVIAKPDILLKLTAGYALKVKE